MRRTYRAAGFITRDLSSSFYIVTIVGLFFEREREREKERHPVSTKLAQKLSIIMRNIRIVWTGRFILSYVWKPILKRFVSIVLETLHAPHWNSCIICYCGYSCSPDGTISIYTFSSVP